MCFHLHVFISVQRLWLGIEQWKFIPCSLFPSSPYNWQASFHILCINNSLFLKSRLAWQIPDYQNSESNRVIFPVLYLSKYYVHEIFQDSHIFPRYWCTLNYYSALWIISVEAEKESDKVLYCRKQFFGVPLWISFAEDISVPVCVMGRWGWGSPVFPFLTTVFFLGQS